MPSDEVTMLYAGAVNYADAALLIHDNAKSSGRDGLILPTHTLIGLAVEMLFKAIFLHKGGGQKTIMHKDIRHDLKELRKLTVAQGFKSSIAEIDEIVDHIGDNYAANEYRYLKPNKTLNKVNVGAAVPVIQSFIDEVANEVGLPVRPAPKG